ncbi:ATP-binding cassette domain-containing protein [Prosthecobacter sp.]|uniref:ATP-binding cassette domain-containing protein n=1 Tax=Prosthecobacter sp. TaxID=1965333 RepID=UPI002AB8EB0C|nr:ATP-binding cassette domain-containing protein [Prosthecobacter sp.]MDZ4405010.1 ATP-binding cassette domain-containing protein [Prosthecobacter sp.]
MKGHISVCAGGSPADHYTLSSAPLKMGSSPDCELSSPGMLPEHARLVWDQRSATWVLTAASAIAGRSIRINGTSVSAPAYLQHGDIIEMPDVYIRFQRVPDAPVFRGQPIEELRLAKLTRVLIGRSSGEADDPDKLSLDATDAAISREHVLLEKDAPGDWSATDKSQAGTPLNDQFFLQKKLQVGDRMRVGSYTFEFTGHSLRRVPRQTGGQVKSRGIAVTLKSGRTILKDVTLDIERCTFVGIVGGSGQGKSTLLNALCGINPATYGSVYINDVPLNDTRQMAAAGIGFVPQDDIVHMEITVEQALHFSARLRLPPETPQRAIDSLVDETIGRLGLAEHRTKRISQLSGGQRKRVSIATELLSRPSVLFLDEPSSGLDPATEFSLMSLLNSLAKTCTVVCTTHVLENAQLFDKLIFVQDGHVVCDVETEHADARKDETPIDLDDTHSRSITNSSEFRLRSASEMALEYFGMTSLLKIYQLFAKSRDEGGKSGAEWLQEFKQRHGHVLRPDFGSPVTEVSTSAGAVQRGGGYLRSLIVLLTRQWAILRADPLNLVFLAAQPLLIAVLVGWVADEAVLRSFLCIVATLWFGCSNGAQQIVREIPIYRRERVCGLGMNCYLQSKYVFLGAVTTLQALLLFFVTLFVAHMFHPPDLDQDVFREKITARLFPPPAAAPGAMAADEGFAVVEEGQAVQPAAADAEGLETLMAVESQRKNSFAVTLIVKLGAFFEIADNLMEATEPAGDQSRDTGLSTPMTLTSVFVSSVGLKLLALIATSLVGIVIGLAISALVQNSTQAVLWVPLVLIPQILFGGFVVTRPEMSPSVRAASTFVPSYCSQRVMDVAHLLGQSTPRMSNRTRYPVFLTPGGERETIEWETLDGTTSEDYDKVSPHNKSWQNLIVFPGHAGEHVNLFDMIRGVKKYQESVEQRGDVRYPMGIIYHNLQPAMASLGILGLWIGVCYLVTWLGLLRKQNGK